MAYHGSKKQNLLALLTCQQNAQCGPSMQVWEPAEWLHRKAVLINLPHPFWDGPSLFLKAASSMGKASISFHPFSKRAEETMIGEGMVKRQFDIICWKLHISYYTGKWVKKWMPTDPKH